MNQQKIGSFIRELRKEQGITQEQLAEQFNVSTRTISRWETGHNMPDISLLVEISEFFDVSIPEIINGERKSETINEEVKEVAEKLSDYAGEEKINIIKNIRNLSVVGVVAVIISYILESAGVVAQYGFAGIIFSYCETLVPVTVIMIAFYSTGLMNKIHKKRQSSVLDNFPKAIRIVIATIIAFAVAAMLKLFSVKLGF